MAKLTFLISHTRDSMATDDWLTYRGNLQGLTESLRAYSVDNQDEWTRTDDYNIYDVTDARLISGRIPDRLTEIDYSRLKFETEQQHELDPLWNHVVSVEVSGYIGEDNDRRFRDDARHMRVTVWSMSDDAFYADRLFEDMDE